MPTPRDEFIAALNAGDVAKATELLRTNSSLSAQINEACAGFDAPAIVHVAWKNDRRMIDALLDAGADINIKSHWWAGGSTPAHAALCAGHDELARHLVERGAIIDAHVAAGLDLLE